MNDELFAYQTIHKLQHHFNPTILISIDYLTFIFLNLTLEKRKTKRYCASVHAKKHPK